MSRYQPSLRELAMEPDEDKRLEMAAAIDEDAAELDDRWDEREEWDAERDRYREERDESRRRYADRFFAVEGQTLFHANEVGEEVRREPIRSADEIWD